MDAKENLMKHRLNSWEEIRHYLIQPTKDEFLLFSDIVYEILLNLHPGERIVIEDDVRPESREKFIKVGCMFILENHPDYEFSDDYSCIRRLSTNPEERVKKVMLLIQKRKLKNELERTSGADSNTAQREKNNTGNSRGNKGN